MDTFDLGCAVLASAVYRKGRNEHNWTPEAPGATWLDDLSDPITGFEATAYQYQGRVVIAFAGTDPSRLNDWAANVMLFMGGTSAQLVQAAEFYEKVKAQYGSDITFTGHSLGGGLAALMGAFFDKPAVTFDPAPFRLAATQDNARTLQQYLSTATPARPAYADADLAAFATTETPLAAAMPSFAAQLALVAAGTASPLSAFVGASLAALVLARAYPTTIRGEAGIRSYAVSGEALTAGHGPLLPEWLNALRIHSGAQPTLLDIEPQSAQVTAVDLHSMQLLVATATAPSLEAQLGSMPLLAEQIFDKRVYARDAKSTEADFLNKLLQSEYGSSEASGIIAKFSADLQRLNIADGTAAQPAMQRALTVAALDYYYFADPANAVQLFTPTSDAIHLDFADVAASLYSLNGPRKLAGAVQPLLAAEEWAAVGYKLDTYGAWHLQAGGAAMSWEASREAENVAVGGTLADSLVGGGQADVIVGLAGQDALLGGSGSDILLGGADADWLDGGDNSDTLYGGAGTDTYNFSGSFGGDSISDSDGLGSIVVDGQAVTGGDSKKIGNGAYTDGTWLFALVPDGSGGNNLVLQRDSSLNAITIRDWSNGQLGITLSETPAPPPPVSSTYSGDYAKQINSSDPTRYVFDAFGNYANAGAQTGAQDLLHGSLGNDAMLGLAGNDGVSGSDGQDAIDGGDGDDLLFGGLGADTLSGGIGKDFIYGSGWGVLTYPMQTTDAPPVAPGPEYTRGFSWVTYDAGIDANGIPTYGMAGANAATLDGDAGNIIDGGEGDDWIRAGSGGDIVHGGADKDGIYGLAGNDVLFGDEGDDRLSGDGIHAEGYVETVAGQFHGGDVLVGGAGNDVLHGQGGSDELYGDADDDFIHGDDSDEGFTPAEFHGADHLDGGDGLDTLLGGGGADELLGGEGSDTLVGDDTPENVAGQYHGDDYLDGEDGNDALVGTGGADVLFGGAGDDHLEGDGAGVAAADEGNDYLEGEDGNDYLDGGGANDLLFGGANDDTLAGGSGDDELFGETGADVLAGGDGSDYLDGAEGIDQLQGNAGNDELFGGAEGDTLWGGDGDDALSGEDGNDWLQAGLGSDMLVGSAGDDTLLGDDGAGGADGSDYLDGGDGADLLQGGAGNDNGVGGMGEDVLYGQDGDDHLDGGSDNDQLIAGEGNDVLLGGGGNDTLWGIAGANTLDGGDGDDMLIGGSDGDTLVGGIGVDYLDGGAGDDTYIFDAGDSASLALAESIGDTAGQNHLVLRDGQAIAGMTIESSPYAGYWTVNTGSSWVLVKNLLSGAMSNVTVGAATYAWQEFAGKTLAISVVTSTSVPNQQLVGGKLDDRLTAYGGGSTFWGGAGTDVLLGDGGNNTYVFHRGDGHDTVTEYRRNPASSTIRFGAGIALDDLLLSTDGGQLHIGLKASNGEDVLSIVGYNALNPLGSTGIAQFAFADGQTLSYQSVIQRGVTIRGTSGDDTLAGSSVADTFDAGAGNDLVSGKGGADTYLFGRGDGNDTLADQDSAAGTVDRLLFKPGVTAADLLASRYQDDLVLRIAGSSDSARLKDWYLAAGNDRVEIIEFDDGSTLDASDVDALVALHAGDAIVGQPGSDVLYGTSGHDAMDGAAGNDLMYGDVGNDTLTGGTGNDSMQGGAGSDTYLIGAGSRDDVIDERPGGDAAGIDTLRFGDGVTSQSVTFLTSGSDLVIRDDARGVSVTVAGQFAAAAPANQIERFEFDGGVVLTAADVKTAAQAGSQMSDWIQGVSVEDEIAGGYGHDTIYGAAGDDRLHGDQGSDSLSGDTGNDSLYGDSGFDTLLGGDGNDALDGGTGFDRLDGGNGDDVYVLGLGSGNDIVVQDASGTDAVQIAAGLTTSNVTLHRVSSPAAADIGFNGDSLAIQINGGSDQLWIANYFASGSAGYVERIDFADGTSWDYAAVSARLASPGGTANTLTGTNKADTFVIDHWNDVLPATLTSGDKAQSSASYRVPTTPLASFTLTGSLNLFAVPSGQGYPIVGNAGDNYFESIYDYESASFQGGRGSDVYVTRTTLDMVTTDMDPASLGMAPLEIGGEGSDTLMSGYWSAQLTANVENLLLIAPNSVANNNLTFYGYQQNDFTHRLIGNALDNTIDTTLYEDKLYSQWWYSYRNNPLLGAGTFRLDGGAGADTLIGGKGDDVYVIDNAGDTVIETGFSKAGYDYSSDTVETVFSTSLAQYAHVENITLTGGATTSATGDGGNNCLDGSVNAAANVLTGGAGNDTYVVGVGDTVVEQAGEGSDTIVVAAASGSVVRVADYANAENLRLTAGVGNLEVQGDANANALIGSLGNNRLSAGDGDDSVADQYSADTQVYYGQFAASDSDTLEGGAGNDTLTTYGGNDVLDGGAGDDSLGVHGRVAGNGSPQAGTVTLRLGFGDGHDVLTRSNDALNQYAVEFKSGVSLPDLQLSAANRALVATLSDGSSLSLADAMAAGSSTQLASGLLLTARFADGTQLGAAQLESLLRTSDRATATESDDVLFGTAAAEAIGALGGDDLVAAGDGNDFVDGGAGNDALYGGAGDDSLAGRVGNDLLAGGNGADLYRFSQGFGKDSIGELLGTTADDGAIDLVEFDGTVAVGDVAVYRQVSGSTATGLVLALPNSGDSIDLNRSYDAGSAGAVELVRFSTGTQWDVAAMKARIAGEVGMQTDDSLNGTASADLLDGRAGADTLTGLGGNDIYYVDNVGDLVVEASNAGTDTVVSGIDCTLGVNVENLRLDGGAPLKGTGNTLNNTLTGNAGANRLDGASGADTMIGGLGDDTYVVNANSDAVTELAGEGVDSVESSIAHTLGANVENLLLTGASKLSGTGNALDNRITGNAAVNSLSGAAGNDWLDGAGGADSMTGGAGDDTYIADNASDKTVESASGGFDSVQTSLARVLSAEVERLFLTGGSAVNGTGNASHNWLIGNDAVNTLDGSTGSDVLIGRAGNDTLQDSAGNNTLDAGADNDTLKGGTGNDLLAGGRGTDTLTLGGGADIVAFNRGDGTDTVAAPASGAGAGERNDTLSVGKALWSELALSRESNDLLVKLATTGDSLRLKDWYLSSANQTVTRLQWVVDSSSEYAPGSSDLLRNGRVCFLDFASLAASFDAAKAANPSLVDWRPSDATLLGARIGASDSSAYGGAFAYRQAQDGTLSNVGTGSSADLAATGFGSTQQSIAGGGGSAGGVMMLSDSAAAATAASAANGEAKLPPLSAPMLNGIDLVASGSPSDTAVPASSPAPALAVAGAPVPPSGALGHALPVARPAVTAQEPLPVDARLSAWLQGAAPTGTAWSPVSASSESGGAAASVYSSAETMVPRAAENALATVPLQADMETVPSATPMSAGSSALATSPAGDLFPAHWLFSAVAPQGWDASDVQRLHVPPGLPVDIRTQWRSVDAWTALQQTWLDSTAGVDARVREFDIGLRQALNCGPHAVPLQASAKRIDTVARFNLAELA